MGIQNWIKSICKRFCSYSRRPGIWDKAWLREIGYEREWIKKYVVEPLKGLGIELPKISAIYCFVEENKYIELDYFYRTYLCYEKKKEQLIKAMQGQSYLLVAVLAAECLILLDSLEKDILAKLGIEKEG